MWGANSSSRTTMCRSITCYRYCWRTTRSAAAGWQRPATQTSSQWSTTPRCLAGSLASSS